MQMHQVRGFAVCSLVLCFMSITLAATGTAQESDSPTPVSIRIPHAVVDNLIEPLHIVNGIAQDPTGLWTVGWYQESASLGEPGFLMFYGIKEFWNAGPGAFTYLNQVQPGHRVVVTGSDGMAYRYEVVSVETFPRDGALAQIFEPPAESQYWLLLMTNALYDATLGPDSGRLVIKAVWSPESTPRPAPAESKPAVNVDRCAAVDLDLQQSPYVSLADLRLPESDSTDSTTIEEIDEALLQFSECVLAVREALTLPDGNVLAQVGPSGHVTLENLTGAVDTSTGTVTSMSGAQMFKHVLFINQGGIWTAFAPPTA